MIKKYQAKPNVIEAVQYTGSMDNLSEILEFTHARLISFEANFITIHTFDGDMMVTIDDFIIKGIKGEFYHCKPDIFEQTYEPHIEVSI